MADYSVQRDDIGSSKILSKAQRKWLDGDEDALSYPDRQIWRRIRNRISSAYTEMAYIHERLPEHELEKVMMKGGQHYTPSVPYKYDGNNSEALRGSALGMAHTVGMGSTVDMIESELENADGSGQPGVELVAGVVKQILEDEKNDVDTWEAFSAEVRQVMED